MLSDPESPRSALQNAYARICPACSQAFEPSRRWQRFCAPRCRARAHRRNRSRATSARSVAVVVSGNGGGYLDDFQHFAVSVSERLQKGQETYQGRSFSSEPHALIGEIRDELRDVVGWAFVLDCRLARVAEALEQASVTIAGETNHRTETAAPTSASSRDGGGDPQPMPRARDARRREGP
jgi:hypothetical protein